MAHVCPWPCAYLFDNALRRIFQKPERIVGPYLDEGMTALDIGCGMGFFSIAMAKLVGEKGRVIAIDLQPQMLDVLVRRARRAGVGRRIETRACTKRSLGVTEHVDFALAMWSAHEVPDEVRLFGEVRTCLKPSGRFLLAEPKVHISRRRFDEAIALARRAGLRLVERPRVGLSWGALFEVGADA